MKILTVIGARPQFIKAAVVSRHLHAKHTEIIVHTGQHFDASMSSLFFRELDLLPPDFNLGVGSDAGPVEKHIEKARQELIRIIKKSKPDIVLVYGDTYSTLAGALAAADTKTPLAHVEAGMRSFNLSMPEEFNRIICDGLSDLLFCPTRTAVENLKAEGRISGVRLTGDVMYDACLYYMRQAEKKSKIMDRLNLKPEEYCLATLHRRSNADNSVNLKKIFLAFRSSNEKIILPLHPRTRKMLGKFGMEKFTGAIKNVRILEPAGYFDLLVLEKNAKKIITDSGGMQKEAYFLKVPCITLREETEWTETVRDRWNVLVGTDTGKIVSAIKHFNPRGKTRKLFGNGNAGRKIVRAMECFA